MVTDSVIAAGSSERIRALKFPVIDLSHKSLATIKLIVQACEEFGFFKVINHGVPKDVVARMEAESTRFFSLPAGEKQMVRLPCEHLGYGRRKIGANGDAGELEYLLLHTDPTFISQNASAICRKDPIRFRIVVNDYVNQVRQLACELLDMLGEGLGLEDSKVFGSLINENDNDSLLRLNHYFPCSGCKTIDDDHQSAAAGGETKNNHHHHHHHQPRRTGFGEHTDPQILSILRSNDEDGLQILPPAASRARDDGASMWIPVPSDPTAFFIIVGDALQVMTNGRVVSGRHRVMLRSGSGMSRLSIVFFGAPPLQARITPLPAMVKSPHSPGRYRSFSWAEYKEAMYSLNLGDDRLALFTI